MKRAAITLAAAVAFAAALSACTERPQSRDDRRPSVAAAEGTGTRFVAPGWQAGDARSWQEQLRQRTQRGQNEYTRTGI